jgi:hypothetical protein
VLVVSWVVILRYLVGLGHTSTFAFAVTLAYPIGDLVVVTVGLMWLARAWPWQRTPIVFLLAGVVAMAASNDTYMHLMGRAGYTRGGLLDIGWAASLLVFALAALLGGQAQGPDLTAATSPGKAMLWLPYVPLALAGGVVTADLLRPEATVVLLLGVGLVGAVLIRQFLIVGENRRLLATVVDQAVRDPLTGLANRTLSMTV